MVATLTRPYSFRLRPRKRGSGGIGALLSLGWQGLYDVWSSPLAEEQAAFTTPVSDGNVVGRWGDLTPNDRDLAVSVDDAANKPIWDADFRGCGHGGVKFNATTDDLILVENPIYGISATAPAPFSVFWAGATDNMIVDRTMWGFKHTSGNQLVLCQNQCAPATNDRPRHLFRRNDGTGNADLNSEVANVNTAFALLWYKYDGTTQFLYQNGILIASAAGAKDGNNTLSTFCLGGTFDGTTQVGNWFGWVFACGVMNVAVSDAQRLQTDRYYSQKLGLNWSAATSGRKTYFFGDSHTYRDYSEQPDFLSWPGKLQLMLAHPNNAAFCNRAISGKHLTGAGAHTGASAPDIDTLFANADTDIDTDSVIWLGPSDGNCARSDTLADVGTDQEDADNHVETVLWPAAKALIDAMLAKTGCVGVMDTSPLRDPTEAAHRRDIVDQMNVRKRNYILRFRNGIHAATWDTLRGGSGNGLSVTYQKAGDTLHLNDAGMTALANAADAAEDHWEYDPATNLDCVLWISGCDQSAALADGDPVGTVAAIVGDDGTAAGDVRPTFQLAESAASFRSVLRFDGIDDAVTLTELPLGSNWMVLFVVKRTAGAAVFGHSSGSGEVGVLSDVIYAVSNGNVGIQWTVTLADFDIVIVTSDSKCYVNGTLKPVALDEGFAASHALTLDRLGDGTVNGNVAGDIADGAVFAANLPASEKNILGQHFAHVYGKTWTQIE